MSARDVGLAAVTAGAVPHSIESEQAVLGGLLLDNDAIDRAGWLLPEHFYRADHAAIFRHIVALLADGVGADAVTVFERLAAHGLDAHAGGLAYLNALALQTPGSANIARYAATVRDRALKRQLLAVASDLPALVAGGEPARAVLDRVQARLEALAQERTMARPVRASEEFDACLGALREQAAGAHQALATGFRALDTKLGGGLRAGELVIVAGRPAMGKTAFALNVACHAARGHSVLVLSLEMPKAQLHQRNLAMLAEVPLPRLRQPEQLGDEDWRRLAAARSRVAELGLFLDDQPALSLADVRAKARMVRRRHGLDLLVIDYLGLMSGGASENRSQEVGSYSRGLKALAKELGIPVIALAQLNRSLESRANKRPLMGDLRDSGELEQDADIILLLYRDEVYHPESPARGMCEVLVEKQRQGETGSVPLAYHGETTRFLDAPAGYRAPAPRPARAIREDL
ncbi:replicative DNA helicase [Cupriavidus malaysiensis]|uniref:Replicative DNA helicase n=1 Tax=Cupriavidus malaysiensis TaxID=367825 RepID=A0ABM6FER0_9BURK|nr:replicative DNA helicase [Cupriavidus malaysiensis]AOZ10365.1 replicative DNA helicase [Cupriavidus malaysiensis]